MAEDMQRSCEIPSSSGPFVGEYLLCIFQTHEDLDSTHQK